MSPSAKMLKSEETFQPLADEHNSTVTMIETVVVNFPYRVFYASD